MRIRLLLPALAVSFFVAASAGAAGLPGASSDSVDVGMLKTFVGGGATWAQAACQKATESCDAQPPCCGGLKCVTNVFDKTKVCDFRG